MGRETKPKIGEVLLACGLVSGQDIAEALAEQKRCGSRLGSILTARGSVGSYALHRELAAQVGLPFVNLEKEICDIALLDAAERANYLRLRAIPWRLSRGRVLIAVPEVTPEAEQWAELHFPAHGFVIASPIDISRSVQRFFGEMDGEDARDLLWKHDAEKSARVLFASAAEKVTLMLMLAAMVAALFVPGVFQAAFIALNLFFTGTLVCKLVFFAAGCHPERGVSRVEGSQAMTGDPSTTGVPPFAQDDKILPVYTLLVPMYKEKRGTIENLVAAIRALDYPKAKLDVKFILEADDAETLAAIREIRPEGWCEVIRVPYSQPRTKPKACNYALKFARGGYVTIYDAEDRPDPQQLRKVLGVFRASPQNTACVQARLNYYNYSENLLTRMFALEYASWFDFLLPGLEKLGIPIPLGGTSNHFPIEMLKKFYAWDPYNVTEDADLGIRIAHYGCRVALSDSLTLEEAPVGLSGWLKQRSRWIKGYIQTYIVHMRRPYRLCKTLGIKGFFGFLFFIGAPALVFLTLPFVLLASLASLWLPLGLPGWFFWFSAGNFLFGAASHALMALLVCRKRENWRNMRPFALLFPFYWILHSIASFRAFWQLFTRPHYWEKTEHGLSKIPAEGKAQGSA